MLTLAYGGGPVALEMLEKVDLGALFGKAQPFWGTTVSPEFPLECIRVRLGLEARERLYPEEYSFAATVSCKGTSSGNDKQLVLERKHWDRGARVAFDRLCVCDPDTAIELLLDGSLIDPRGVAGINPDQGYVLGSYFAWRCGKDRRRHLRSLLSASDPSIQVAGATYLCFESEHEGIRELRTRMKFSGDPGVWAAINLARRGDAGAIPRALEVLAAPSDPTFLAEWHRTLESRLMELLSNSAKASGVPLPSLDGISTYDQSEWRSQRFARYLLWWHTYDKRIHLTDPWLSELSRQRVD